MREIPNPLSSLTESLGKKKPKKTLGETLAPLQQIFQKKFSQIGKKNSKALGQKQEAPAIQTSKASPISVSWARHEDEV